MDRLPLYAIATGGIALVVAALFYFRVKSADEGSAAMSRIARYIREGAMAFLVREYKVLAIYAAVVSTALFFGFQGQGLGGHAALAFLSGAFLSLLAGFFGMTDAYGDLFGVQRSNSLHHVLQPVVHSAEHEISHATEFRLAALTTGVGLAGIALATLLYFWRRDLAPKIAAAIRPLYALVRDKYRIDELYDAAIVRPLRALSSGLLSRGVDQGLIDGLVVNGTAKLVRASADGALKYLQSGFAQSYLVAMLLGGVLLIAWLVRGT